MQSLTVLHVITTLAVGGAETMLLRLVTRPTTVHHEVVCLTGGRLMSTIQEAGIKVTNLDVRRGQISPGALRRLSRAIANFGPDVVQTWMYHSDLAGGLAAKLSSRPPVVWGIHHTTMDRTTASRLTRLVRWACTVSSDYLPQRIICCSEATRRCHEHLGYNPSRLVVVPNGCDTDLFQPDEAQGMEMRDDLGIAPAELVVGVASRYHPHKDLRSMILAAGMVVRQMPRVRFVMCGTGVDNDNDELIGYIEEEKISDNVLLIGRHSNMPTLINAFDIVCSSSISEAMPLVLQEALSSGKPCVATDVGDSALVVGKAGRIVPPGRPDLLAEGLISVLSCSHEERTALGKWGRQHIEENYSLESTARRYEEVWEDVAHMRHR